MVMPMQTFTFKTSDHLGQRLHALSQQLHLDPSELLQSALEQFLEDEEDYLIAAERLAQDDAGKRIPFHVIKQRYGLED